MLCGFSKNCPADRLPFAFAQYPESVILAHNIPPVSRSGEWGNSQSCDAHPWTWPGILAQGRMPNSRGTVVPPHTEIVQMRANMEADFSGFHGFGQKIPNARENCPSLALRYFSACKGKLGTGTFQDSVRLGLQLCSRGDKSQLGDMVQGNEYLNFRPFFFAQGSGIAGVLGVHGLCMRSSHGRMSANR